MTQSGALYHPYAYINGTWREAQSGARFHVEDPARGRVITGVADCGAVDARAAIEAAAAAFPAWRAEVAGTRAAILRRWHDLMVAEIDDLAGLVSLENGKPLAEARGEIAYGASYLDWFAGEAVRAYGEVIPSASPRNRVLALRQPVGVVAAITPWNFPNAMLMRKAAAALAAGCTLVSKPAEDTPLSALAIARLAEQAGVPAGVFNVVPTSDPAAVGGELTRHPLVRKVSFTGSTEVGRLLLEQSAGTVKRVSMELGGNAPFIVFDDTDVEAALDGAMASKYRNAGQTCVCANRFFVQRGLHDAFLRGLAERTRALTVAPGDSAGAQIGPLINADGLAKVERLLSEARGAGAAVLTGGTRHSLGGLFFEPTVVAGVTPEMSIAREEIFGPVATVISFDTEEDAVRLANDTIFGLAAYLYTADLGRAWRMSEALDYGMVAVNEGILSNAAAPFGGIKQSGMGREGSLHGLDDYLDIKYVLMGGLSA